MSFIMFQNWDCPRPLPDWETDQDLVPEPEDEVEEGAQDGQHERHADAPDAPRPCLRSPSHGNYHLCLPSCAIGYFTIESVAL